MNNINEKLFSMACAGDIDGLKNHFNNGGAVNLRYESFGKLHSLLMGAYNNNQYDTITYLMNVGEKLTVKEKAMLKQEYLRQKTLEKLALFG